MWKSLGRAHALRGHGPTATPLVFLTTQLPRPRTDGDNALRAAGPDAFFDAVDLLDDGARDRLGGYARGGRTNEPQPGFWSPADLARRSG